MVQQVLYPNNPFQPGPNSILGKALKKADKLETAALEAIKVNHHLKMHKEAIKTGKLPKGLIPTVHLTVHAQTQELTSAVNDKLVKCWVQICRLLKLHYTIIMKQTNSWITELEDLPY